MIDLEPFQSILIDPSRFFVRESGEHYPLIVEHATGKPRFVLLPEGTIRPYGELRPGRMMAAAQVVNPDGFQGFPEHDRANAAFQPERHGLDPAAFFTHWQAEHPVFVENATGRPKYRVVGGELVAIAA